MLISLAAYFAASWWAGRMLGEHGMDKGFSRNLLAGMFAFVVSTIIGYAIDWAFPSQALNLFSIGAMSGQPGGGVPTAKEIKDVEDALRAVSR